MRNPGNDRQNLLHCPAADCGIFGDVEGGIKGESPPRRGPHHSGRCRRRRLPNWPDPDGRPAPLGFVRRIRAPHPARHATARHVVPAGGRHCDAPEPAVADPRAVAVPGGGGRGDQHVRVGGGGDVWKEGRDITAIPAAA